MNIERDRGSPNGAFKYESMNAIHEAERRASDVFLDYLLETNGITSDNYDARVVPFLSLPKDLMVYFDRGWVYVQNQKTNYGTTTSVFSAETESGVICQTYEDDEPEYYQCGADFMSSIGTRLLEQIFKPGSHPELAELASEKGAAIVNVEELPARLMTPEEYSRTEATATLSRFTVGHLTRVLKIYNEVCFPGMERRMDTEAEITQLHGRIVGGESVGLRRNTKYLSCAKHQLKSNPHDDEFSTWLYLNYDIPFGPVNLHFREDIAMAVEFGEKAAEYFAAEGIDAKT